MNKIIIAIIVVVVVVLGGYFLLRNSQPSAPSYNLPSSPSEQTSQAPKTLSTPTTQTPAPEETSSASQNIINYTDFGFSPNTLRIKVGATVVFKNNSSQSMWTASAVHPTHTVYPVSGGCIASAFDACKGIKPGSSWSFRFDIAGTWKYHNHLNPGDIGTIIVE